MKTTFHLVAPRHQHDCDACRFVGMEGPVDVYVCGESIIRRFGSDGPDYSSFPMGIARQVPDFAGAVALADNYQPLAL